MGNVGIFQPRAYTGCQPAPVIVRVTRPSNLVGAIENSDCRWRCNIDNDAHIVTADRLQLQFKQGLQWQRICDQTWSSSTPSAPPATAWTKQSAWRPKSAQASDHTRQRTKRPSGRTLLATLEVDRFARRTQTYETRGRDSICCWRWRRRLYFQIVSKQKQWATCGLQLTAA